MRKLLCCTYVVAALGCALALCTSESAQAASATGRVTLKVIKALVIEAVGDLVFAPGYPGAAESTVEPVAGGQGGEFLVQGEANTVYTIKLPKEIILQTGAGAADERILIKDFTSYPANTGVIGVDGSQAIYIGATRQALPLNIKDGLYSGSFTVEVIY